MIKVGDKLYCHDNSYSLIKLTEGKLYTVSDIREYGHIISTNSRLTIKDDEDENIFFSIDQDENELSYKNWFIENNEYRKNKLLKIEYNVQY